MSDAQPKNPVKGPSDDTTVRQFVNLSKDLISSVLQRDYIGTFKKASELLNIVGDMFGMFKNDDNADDRVPVEELESLKSQCESAKTSLQGVGAGPNDPKEFDPASILLILELVGKVIDWIKKRRHP